MSMPSEPAAPAPSPAQPAPAPAPAPAAPQPAAPAQPAAAANPFSPPAAPAAPAAPSEPAAPPWGSDDQFDPQRAWTLIQNLRNENAELKPKAQQLREIEDKEKPALQLATEKVTQAEQRATTAEQKLLRYEVAASKGLSPQQAQYLTGTTAEEMGQAADGMLAAFGAAPPAEPGVPAKPPVNQLRPGAVPAAAPEELHPAELAKRVPRG